MVSVIVSRTEKETLLAAHEKKVANLELFNAEVPEPVSVGSLFVMVKETVKMAQMKHARPHRVRFRLSVATEVVCAFPGLDCVMEAATVPMEKMRKVVAVEEVRIYNIISLLHQSWKKEACIIFLLFRKIFNLENNYFLRLKFYFLKQKQTFKKFFFISFKFSFLLRE